MQLRHLDTHGNASIARDQQELAARCGLEEAALRVSEAERTLHARGFSRSMTTEQHHRAVGRDHAALVAAEQVLRVLRRHHERRSVLAAAPRELHEQITQWAANAERANLIEHDVT